MATILIVEDNRGINDLIKKALTQIGHHCFQAYYGMEAIRLTQQQPIQLILLDIQLPDSDGFSLIKELPDLPVIYLTAKNDVSDRVKGLNLGAEDYITKPFAMDELLARIQVVLRRYDVAKDILAIGDKIKIDIAQHEVYLNQTLISLTNQEFELLYSLVINKNMALSREQLLTNAWGMDYNGDIRTVDVHIQRLRKKLQLENEIKTIFKFGYRLEV